MKLEFKDQIGIITGAASGLGQAIALKLSAKGVKLALIDRDKSGLEITQSQLTSESELYLVDITVEADVAHTIKKVNERFGGVDILVNCAGVVGKTNIMSHEVDADNMRFVFDVNFMGSFYTSKYAIPYMLKNNKCSYHRLPH